MRLFSVKSCYSRLNEVRPIEELDTNVKAAITKLWKIDAPSKALVLGWRLLLDRLPTQVSYTTLMICSVCFALYMMRTVATYSLHVNLVKDYGMKLPIG
jgi:hypothetical protein